MGVKFKKFSEPDPFRISGRVHYAYFWEKDDKSDARSSPQFSYDIHLNEWLREQGLIE